MTFYFAIFAELAVAFVSGIGKYKNLMYKSRVSELYEKENYPMLKRIKEEITVKNVKGLNKIAKRAAIGSVNTACSWIFDQPKVPEELKKFRKF